jgi:hypothetical protein
LIKIDLNDHEKALLPKTFPGAEPPKHPLVISAKNTSHTHYEFNVRGAEGFSISEEFVFVSIGGFSLSLLEVDLSHGNSPIPRLRDVEADPAVYFQAVYRLLQDARRELDGGCGLLRQSLDRTRGVCNWSSSTSLAGRIKVNKSLVPNSYKSLPTL